MPFIHHVKDSTAEFQILQTTSLSQSAVMTLGPGEASSDQPSVHLESDQTLILLAGSLKVDLDGEEGDLKSGDAIIVPAGTSHRFINNGTARAVTYSVYSPPAYPPDDAS